MTEAAMSTPRVRSLENGEVALLRDLRLRSLQDAPRSFSERFDEVLQRDEREWRRLAEMHGPGGPHAAFVSEVEHTGCGIAFGIADRAAVDSARVGGMWVSPEFRGRGIGGALLRAVLEWSRAHGRKRVGLWAPVHEPAALALYRREGFRPTGVEKVFRPGMLIVEMKLEDE